MLMKLDNLFICCRAAFSNAALLFRLFQALLDRNVVSAERPEDCPSRGQFYESDRSLLDQFYKSERSLMSALFVKGRARLQTLSTYYFPFCYLQQCERLISLIKYTPEV
jgi:hypothetical protein